MAGQAASGMKTTTALAESERESERRPESKRKERERRPIISIFPKPLQEKDRKKQRTKRCCASSADGVKQAISEIHLNFSAHNLFPFLTPIQQSQPQYTICFSVVF